MQFQSISFLVFLVIIFLIYWRLPDKYRWKLLLVAGYFFYVSYNPLYVLLLFGVTVLTYLTTLQMERVKTHHKKWLLQGYIIVVVGILVLFKYLGFFAEIVQSICSAMGNTLHFSVLQLILPVGISFYIFQTLAYVIDVYYGRIKAERHFGFFAVSVAFFPILLAGPIERIQNLIGELKKEKAFSYENSCMAFQNILIGYMKKMIIADSLAMVVNRIYSDLETYRGFPLLVAIILYSIEIYCDFSGYSDIAIGMAELFGINIHVNFRQPYFADSVKDFWKRWHISLTSWFRDYIYIPLGGNRVSPWRVSRNVLCVYLLSGLWHGANWTFLLWGVLNGVIQIIENIISRKNFPIVLPKSVKRIITFVLVSVMWVFFRADSVPDAMFVIIHCLDGIGVVKDYFFEGSNLVGVPLMQVGLLLLFIIVLFIIDLLKEKGKLQLINGFVVSILITLSMLYYFKYGIDNGTFIYFQF